MVKYLRQPGGDRRSVHRPTASPVPATWEWMTDDGYVRVTGRTKDIVIRGGMNISVREIEDMLVHHPALRASACVGMPDERPGEKVCCYVVPARHEAPTVRDVRDFLLGHGMAIQKTPERVVVVESLPMTATGKVLKHELRKDRRAAFEGETAYVSAGLRLHAADPDAAAPVHRSSCVQEGRRATQRERPGAG